MGRPRKEKTNEKTKNINLRMNFTTAAKWATIKNHYTAKEEKSLTNDELLEILINEKYETLKDAEL